MSERNLIRRPPIGRVDLTYSLAESYSSRCRRCISLVPAGFSSSNVLHASLCISINSISARTFERRFLRRISHVISRFLSYRKRARGRTYIFVASETTCRFPAGKNEHVSTWWCVTFFTAFVSIENVIFRSSQSALSIITATNGHERITK